MPRKRDMIEIAVVEDEKAQIEKLTKYLERFSKENGLEFSIAVFASGESFLSSAKHYDIVLMDIELGGLDGMQTAAALRKTDTETIIIFVTNLAQYAVKGYEVEALDFVVKPISYPVMSLKLSRAVDRIKRNEKCDAREISIKSDSRIYRIKHSDIKYIEILGHTIVYHTVSGEIKSYGTLKKIEAEFTSYGFARCNACYLVNLKYVTSVIGYSVFVGDDELKISQPRRKDFVRSLNAYMCAEE